MTTLNRTRDLFPAVLKVALLFLMFLILPAAPSFADFPYIYSINFVAKVCPNYSDIMQNLKPKSGTYEPLRELGWISNYSPGNLVNSYNEDRVPTAGNCSTLSGWQFTLGKGKGTNDSTPYGSISRVGDVLRVLKNDQEYLMFGEWSLIRNDDLTIQAGKPGDPYLGRTDLAFGAFRCGFDNSGSDNFETVRYIGSLKTITCYAYYVQNSPKAGTIKVIPYVEGSPPASSNPDFPFTGNVAFLYGNAFSRKASETASFTIGGTSASDAPWEVTLGTLPDRYSLRDISCAVSGSGGSQTRGSGNTSSITLGGGDTVSCIYNLRYTPLLSEAKISPVLECTARNAATAYEAWFGYLSSESVPITNPPGSYNRFSPAPDNRGQPYTFNPGRVSRAFSLPFNGSPLTWNLTGKTATASASSAQRCKPNCALPGTLKMAECNTSVVIDGTSSGTHNNSGTISGFQWSTNCPGTIVSADTLRPSLQLNSITRASEQKCKVSLALTDDTRFGSTAEAELQTAKCSTEITIPVCSVDCAGIPSGTTQLDQCGVCGGNNSTCLDCAGVPNGKKQLDRCEVCGGDNSSCSDCAGIPGGTALPDACGVCGGNGDSCVNDCSSALDACGICGGDGSACVDCAGASNGAAKLDNCGVCGGDGSSCGACYLGNPMIKTRSDALFRNLRLLYQAATIRSTIAMRYDYKHKAKWENQIAVLRRDYSRAIEFLKEQFLSAETICRNNLCRIVPTEPVKDVVRDLVDALSAQNANAQRALALYLSANSGQVGGLTVAELQNRIERQLGTMTKTVLVCDGG